MYRNLRTIHLLCGLFALPMLVMYGLSAVQMAHNRWFVLKPVVTEAEMALPPGMADGRAVARAFMERRGVGGEISDVKKTAKGFEIRIVVPGTVHEVRYERESGAARIRTSVAGVMGMLNRLHHAGGLWHEYLPLRVWGVLVGLASLATLALGMTGIWMWWLRRQERMWGLILLGANLAFSLTILLLLRAA